MQHKRGLIALKHAAGLVALFINPGTFGLVAPPSLSLPAPTCPATGLPRCANASVPHINSKIHPLIYKGRLNANSLMWQLPL